MTIKDAVVAAADRLKRARIPEARLEAESLLGHLVKKDLAWLLAHGDAGLAPPRAKAYAALVARRARRTPFAYLVGEKGFYGRAFSVTPAVLIPRPATETLVDAVLSILPPEADATILDVGTGSGAIGLTLAAERPRAKALLCDVSARALAVARRNARRLKLGRRARLAKIDILKRRLPEPEGATVVVANLPYLTAAHVRAAEPEVGRHEPRLALVSGHDGLDHYRALIKDLVRWKRPPELLAFEAGPGQFAELSRLVREAFPRLRIGLLKDLHGDDRVLIASMR